AGLDLLQLRDDALASLRLAVPRLPQPAPFLEGEAGNPAPDVLELGLEPTVLRRVQRFDGGAGFDVLPDVRHAGSAGDADVPSPALPLQNCASDGAVYTAQLVDADEFLASHEPAAGLPGDPEQRLLQLLDDLAQDRQPLNIRGLGRSHGLAPPVGRPEVFQRQTREEVADLGENGVVVGLVIDLGGKDLDFDIKLGGAVHPYFEMAVSHLAPEIDHREQFTASPCGARGDDPGGAARQRDHGLWRGAA